MTKSLMIQGTGSGVGKSLITAGLCRIFNDMGINVAPFKAQNMSLNSCATSEGAEMGRAQALQAEAARIEPSVDMNPVLLKPTGESESQVIINGRVHSNMQAIDYYAFRDKAWPEVTQAYKRLSKKHDLIIIEGAGSPAEINLANCEIVNMRVARYANAPVLLVGDIDKGGVFASFYGTLGLLNGDADYIKAFVINKFRGDRKILNPGLEMIRKKTGRPVIGAIPHMGDLGLHEEDGIPVERIERFTGRPDGSKIKIVVIMLRHISNFTDFDPFIYEPDVEIVYSVRNADIENADMIIIPGSKNTVKDLLFLRENGIEESVERAVKSGIPLVGICGGYQMLGHKIYDPFCAESLNKEVNGIGFLDIETIFEKYKTVRLVEAELTGNNKIFGSRTHRGLKGYEIHIGVTTGDVGLFKLKKFSLDSETRTDGSIKENVWGTYMHGIFDNDEFRRCFINGLRIKRGLETLEESVNYSTLREESLNRWAQTLKENMDMEFIERVING